MAKEFEDKFFKELRGEVIENNSDNISDKEMSFDERIRELSELPLDKLKQIISEMPIEERKKILLGVISVVDSNVIKNPRQLETLKKELVSVEKQIKKQEVEKAVQNGDVILTDVDEKNKEEHIEENKEENTNDEKTSNEVETAKENEVELRDAYYNAMIALHTKRMTTISSQKEKGEFVSSDADYTEELELEAKLYESRDAYLALGKDDPYRQERTEFIQKEKEAREPIELELRNKAKRFREIEEEIKRIDKREREINEELLDENINETKRKELEHEMTELTMTRKNLEIELADVKEKLDNAIDTRRTRLNQRSGLEQRHVETLTSEDKKNYAYQQSKIVNMNHNFDVATKQHYDNIKRRIEEREQKIKDIDKELKDIPDTDFERRLLLLNELDKETNMLEADREAKSDLDRGIIPDKLEMQKDAVEKVDEEEYRQNEFDKSTEDVREVIKEQDEKIGEAVVENPTVANIEEKDRETSNMAATYAIVHDSPVPGEDTVVQDVVQYEVAKCVIPGLEGQVKTIDDTEEGRKNAEEYLEQDKQIREADVQLDRIEEKLTKI